MVVRCQANTVFQCPVQSSPATCYAKLSNSFKTFCLFGPDSDSDGDQWLMETKNKQVIISSLNTEAVVALIHVSCFWIFIFTLITVKVGINLSKANFNISPSLRMFKFIHKYFYGFDWFPKDFNFIFYWPLILADKEIKLNSLSPFVPNSTITQQSLPHNKMSRSSSRYSWRLRISTYLSHLHFSF